MIVFCSISVCVAETAAPLSIELLNRTHTDAFIRWDGVDLKDVKSCQVTHGVKSNNNTEYKDMPEYEVSSVYHLTELLLDKEYSVFVECTDKNGISHISNEFIVPTCEYHSTIFC